MRTKTELPPVPRRRLRQQLVLKVEFDDAAGFRSNYLSDFSDGGVRISTSMEIGQRLLLNISFFGLVEPLLIEAVVQWSQPASHPEGPAAGLRFVDPSPEAAAWLADVLDASTNTFIITPESADRVILLEVQPFLRDVYGQEVRNWAELRDEEPLELIALDDPTAWVEEVTRSSSMLAIMDADGLLVPGIELYRQMRARPISAELPLIIIGSPAKIEPFSTLPDEHLLCLRKPLKFGALMNTVRMLARDPVVRLSRPGSTVDTLTDD